MRKSLKRFAMAGALFAMANPMWAWDAYSHMVIASVAYRNLDSQTRAHVDKLLALNPYFKTVWPQAIPAGTASDTRKRMIFMLAATWPDAIKSDAKYHDDGSGHGDVPDGPEAGRNTGYDDFNRHRYWHFVDQPLSQDGTETDSFQTPAPNASTQIKAFRAVLTSSASNRALQSYDLVWILHLVGDIHQPLHCATRLSHDDPNGDRGGNGVKFCGPTASVCNGNLHTFWDDVLGVSTSVKSADALAAGLDAPSVPAADEAAVESWIGDSLVLAKTRVYVDPPVAEGHGPFRATSGYVGDAKSLARNQVALAGARLAAILKADVR